MDYHNTLFSRRKNSRMGQTVLRLVMLHLEQWPLRRPRQKKAPCQLFPLLSIHEQEIAMWLQPKSRGPVKCRGENDSWHKPALPQLGMFLCVIDPTKTFSVAFKGHRSSPANFTHPSSPPSCLHLSALSDNQPILPA